MPDVAVVEEFAPCAFQININSVYGCPVDCPVSSAGLVCGDKGVCVLGDDGQARCLCESGLNGADCTGSLEPAVAAAESSLVPISP